MGDDEDTGRLEAWYQVDDDGTTTPLDGPPPGWIRSAPSEIPEEAYGRVTDPGRYAVLHTEARALLDRLVAAHDVDRVDGDADLDPDLTAGGRVDAVVRLTPRSPAAAPLTVAFTDFPGLLVRYGSWVTSIRPLCGCDACDEDPASIVEELRDDCAALVAGDFTEALTGDRRHRRLDHRLGGTSGRQQPVPDATADDDPTEHHWSPWPLRPTP